MNIKKILLSTGVIAFVAAVAISATGAFFNDTETSTGNTFTAGAIDLKVDSQQHYNGNTCTNIGDNVYQWTGSSTYPVPGTPCTGTWALTDLGVTNQFFNFNDVKPGDNGEDTISLHIDSNPAWACADINVTSNDDASSTEPELSAGDTQDVASSTFDGELAQNINVFAWLDTASTSGAVAGDNIWQAGEPILYGPTTAFSSIGSTTTLPLADAVANGGNPLPGGATTHVGLAWCAGTMDTSVPGVISCNGTSMGNITQTDSMTANITLRVEQSRNNARFLCSGGIATSTASTTVAVNANTLATSLVGAASTTQWYFYDDTNDVLNNGLGSFVVGPGTPPFGTGSAQMTLAAVNSRTFLATSQFGGIPLSSLTQLSFGEYSQSGVGSATEAPFVRFNVDFSGSPAYQNSLVYVPSANGSITKDVWQSWNMITPTSQWVYSGATWPAPISLPGTTPQSWSAILAAYPSIRMHPGFPQIGVRVGEPGPAGYTGNVDFFTIATSSGATTFNFGN